ncbi:F-box-like domain superfamily [Arabidopsis suecica]|uniref:F-box-like domain superfamily n=1 Tax=Arabidopsis suecica TaxID=45249 RepID=A0A8T2F265_ARASU|nr:F-box-like domain superfamily [Arabidopsis suecica]
MEKESQENSTRPDASSTVFSSSKSTCASPSYLKEAGDLISRLPDDILQLILSYLPTRLAIKTSVLSRRWRHVWSDTWSLSFHRDRPDAPCINRILDRYRAPKMMSFRICSCCRGACISRPDTHADIDSWINFAMSRNVMNLSLYLDEDEYDIPEFLYINSSLKQLYLDFGCKKDFISLNPKCSVSWTSLKNLSLFHCNISDESIANILSGCPILESLLLFFCKKLKVLDLSKSPRLITLEITRRCRMEPTQLVAPHIRCLRLINSEKPCALVDVSSLSQAELDITAYAIVDNKLEADFHQTMVVKMLEKCQNVEKLTLGANFLKMLSLAELRGVSFPKLKAKALILETMISRYVIHGIVKVLQNSPDLKKLTIHPMGSAGSYPIPEEHIDIYLDSHGLNWDPSWSSEFKNTSRRNVESKQVASFLQLVLKTISTLELIVARLEGYIKGRRFVELRQMVPMLPRNNDVSIVLSSRRKRFRVT